jgi:hypothetical protein
MSHSSAKMASKVKNQYDSRPMTSDLGLFAGNVSWIESIGQAWWKRKTGTSKPQRPPMTSKLKKSFEVLKVFAAN